MTGLYKILARGRTPVHGGTGPWPKPGEWTERISPVVPCERGYHLCRPGDLRRWLTLDAIVWEVEPDGPLVACDDKIVAERARLLRPVGVLRRDVLVTWACDCAERVLPICEGDARPRDAIETTRRWVRGEATIDEVRAAAATAAAYAAYAAATAAAYAAYAAAYAAATAAYDAANAAAYDAIATTRADFEWQDARLLALIGGAT